MTSLLASRAGSRASLAGFIGVRATGRCTMFASFSTHDQQRAGHFGIAQQQPGRKAAQIRRIAA
jgi:hypothetical protein